MLNQLKEWKNRQALVQVVLDKESPEGTIESLDPFGIVLMVEGKRKEIPISAIKDIRECVCYDN